MIDNAKQPEQAAEFGLDPENVMDYDFEDAKNNIKTYVEEVMAALASKPCAFFAWLGKVASLKQRSDVSAGVVCTIRGIMLRSFERSRWWSRRRLLRLWAKSCLPLMAAA